MLKILVASSRNLLVFKQEGNHSLSSSNQSEGMVEIPHAWHKLHKYMHSNLDLGILRDSLALFFALPRYTFQDPPRGGVWTLRDCLVAPRLPSIWHPLEGPGLSIKLIKTPYFTLLKAHVDLSLCKSGMEKRKRNPWENVSLWGLTPYHLKRTHTQSIYPSFKSLSLSL